MSDRDSPPLDTLISYKRTNPIDVPTASMWGSYGSQQIEAVGSSADGLNERDDDRDPFCCFLYSTSHTAQQNSLELLDFSNPPASRLEFFTFHDSPVHGLLPDAAGVYITVSADCSVVDIDDDGDSLPQSIK
jgi:hypothetical protein